MITGNPISEKDRHPEIEARALQVLSGEVEGQEALQMELAMAASLADHKPENFSDEEWQAWNQMTTGAPLTRAQFEAHQRQY